MREITFSFQWFTLLFLVLQNLAFGSPRDLKTLLHQEMSNPKSSLSQQVISELQKKHVVFVDGVMNELAAWVGNYFFDNIAAVEELGVSHSHLRFSSRQAVSENANHLFLELLKIREQHLKPIILIGHSMGGAEALSALLRFPQLILEGWVEKVILIQPAVGGSILAEAIKPNFLAHTIKAYLGPGLESLRTDVAQIHIQKEFQNFINNLSTHFTIYGEDQHALFEQLSNRIYYVRSAHTSEEPLSWGIKTVQYLFSQQPMEEPNDGLLTVSNQILNSTPAFGVDLGILEADHLELVVSGKFSRSSTEKRQAFTRAILSAIYLELEPIKT